MVVKYNCYKGIFMCYRKKVSIDTLGEIRDVTNDFFEHLKKDKIRQIAKYNQTKILKEFKKYSNQKNVDYYEENKKININNLIEIKEKIFTFVNLNKFVKHFISTLKSYYESIKTIDINIKNCEKLKLVTSDKSEIKRISLIKKKNKDLKKVLEDEGMNGVFNYSLSEAQNGVSLNLFVDFSNIYSRVIKNKFYDPNYDDKWLFLFGQLPANTAFSVQNINKFRSKNPSQYNCFIKNYIRKFHILDVIKDTVKKTYIVKERQLIIERGIDFYIHNDYLLSIIVLIAQVEGLLVDSLRLTGKDNVADRQTLSTKIDEIELYSTMDFIKYTFEEIRNDIAHGNIPKNELLEKNFIVISTLHFVITELFGGRKEYNYLKIESLLEKWLYRNDKRDVISAFELLGNNFTTLEIILFILPIDKNYLSNSTLKQQRKEIMKFVCNIKNWKIISEYDYTETYNLNGKSIAVSKNCSSISNIDQVLKSTIKYFKQYNNSKLNDYTFKLIKNDIFKKVNR